MDDVVLVITGMKHSAKTILPLTSLVSIFSLVGLLASGCGTSDTVNDSAVPRWIPPEETTSEGEETETRGSSDTLDPGTSTGEETSDTGGQECEIYQTVIFAGQTFESGTVTVSNTDSDLVIELASIDPWKIKKIDVFAGTDPVPMAPGQFPYHQEFEEPVTAYVFEIPLEEIGIACNETLNIAIHTEMVRLKRDQTYQEETGWAWGPYPFPQAWGWWFDYLVCCEEPEPEERGCSYTQGYWKNHHANARNLSQRIPWPIPENSLLCGQTWLNILKTPPQGGNAWYILAHQWIAAMLNVANGASSSSIEEALEHGEALLSGCSIAAEDRTEALAIAATLDAFNNGWIGPGHCDDKHDSFEVSLSGVQ